MKTAYRRSTQALIPPYQENGALQLIVASGVTFIMFHFVRIVMLIMGKDKEFVFQAMFPNFSLSELSIFREKSWTILTYGWVHHGFFDWITNMIWAYCFASVLQTLAGYKQVLPLFFYALLSGGVFFLASQYLDGPAFSAAGTHFLGAQAGGHGAGSRSADFKSTVSSLFDTRVQYSAGFDRGDICGTRPDCVSAGTGE